MVDDEEDDDEEEEDDEMDMGVKEEEEDDEEEDGMERKKRMMLMGMDGVSGAPGQQQHHFQQLQIQQGVGLVQGGGGPVQVGGGGGGGMGVRRSRPKEEKERTKLRERHRRAITARILSGLRRHGNYNLRVRADINDVIAALAREAGWMVLPDGTTLPPPTRSPHNTRPPAPAPAVATTPLMVASQSPPASSLRGASGFRSSVEYRPCRLKGVFTPTSASSFDGSSGGRTRPGAGIGEEGDHSSLLGNCLAGDDKQVIDLPPRVKERDFAGTPYVPVYVMLPVSWNC
ncbi:unnamed protein product [Victoria cruziana]